ncbi:MAG: PIG-L family deacetylase [Thermoguttaceae bacterium]
MPTRLWISLNVVAWMLLSAAIGLGDSPSPPVEAKRPADGKLRIIVFGAHPDDAEIRAGGAAVLWSALGHHVKLVSVTNGDAGHTRMTRQALAARRVAEVQAASKILGTTSQVLDIHDGELMPTLENRRTMTRLIRSWNADVVIAHRPNDYHPDHRYVGVLAQDSAFMVTVPLFCPDTPYLKDNPVFLYSYDTFERPNPFRPDIVVSIDGVIERKLDALLLLESQFVEGGANSGRDPFPNNAAERAACARRSRERFATRFASIADRGREKLIELYGEEEGRKVKYAEAFEICEFGRRPTADDIRRLFPFLPQKKSAK